VETTALGAAYLAGLAAGYWHDIDEIRQQWQTEREFSPVHDRSEVEKGIRGWERAVHAVRAWSGYEDQV
jgi:glycerol kinase